MLSIVLKMTLADSIILALLGFSKRMASVDSVSVKRKGASLSCVPSRLRLFEQLFHLLVVPVRKAHARAQGLTYQRVFTNRPKADRRSSLAMACSSIISAGASHMQPRFC
jgi:hypothetical protein